MRDTLTIDFETYYDVEYTLKKLTVQEYVRDERFEVVGVAVKHNDGETQWYSGPYLGLRAWLVQFPWEESICVAHNAQFDGAILEWLLGIHPHSYFCTMMGSRPFVAPFTGKMSLAECAKFFMLPAKGTEVATAVGKRREDFDEEALSRYAEYCKHDVTLSYMLYVLMRPELHVDEADSIDLTVKKYTKPILQLDKPTLGLAYKEEMTKRDRATARVQSLVPGLNVNSNPQFADALKRLGAIPPTKISPTTGKTTYAFAKSDSEFIDLVNHDNPAISALCASRLILKSSINHTRLKKFMRVHDSGGPFAVPLIFCGAHTWRLSGGGGLNLQNLGRGSALRHAIKAPAGYEIVVGDLSQIEARIVATLAGQDDLIAQFADGDDVYCKFAERVYARKLNKKDNPDERFVGKIGILSLGYNAGWIKFRDTMKGYNHPLPDAQCQRIVQTYRTVYDKITKLWKTADNLIPAMNDGIEIQFGPVKTGLNCIILPNGMKIHYPKLQLGLDGWSYMYQGTMRKKIYGGALVENICQALARIILNEMELYLSRRNFLGVLQVHDELVYCVPTDIADKFAAVLTKVMSIAPEWLPDLPVACEVERGASYGDAK